MNDAYVNIAAHLPRMAKEQPEAMAIALPVSGSYEEWSYLRLEEESNRIARGLEAHGIGRGVRTALMVPPGREFFALTFALFKIGAVPVLIDPGLGIKNLKVCLAEAEIEAFIGIPKAHIARLLFKWGKATLRRWVTVGSLKFWGGARLSEIRSEDASPVLADTRQEDTAAILFTSGSTGVPKGVVYSHGNFAAQVEILRRIYKIQPGEIDLPTFPLFALFAPALGMSSVIPEMNFTRPADVDARKILSAVKTYGVTQMFGSPALINRVGRYLEAKDISLPSLKRVISAGAPVQPIVLERFARHLSKDAEIHTPYGATEALPVASIGSKEILSDTRTKTAEGAGVCVGIPVCETRVKIIRISDRPIPEWSADLEMPKGEIGEIIVSGPVVTRSYFNREKSTRLAKILDPHSGGFYHRMGDIGYIDAQGRLWFCGRKAHRVATPERVFYTVPCEAVFNEHARVYRTALVGIVRERQLEPVLCVELEKDLGGVSQGLIRKELLALGARHAHTQPIRKILFHKKFPVDIRHNAKIFREKLAVWASREVGA